jgi:hypothetical protein
LGLGPFRSPLLRTSRLISLPPGTEMFQFPGFASLLPVMTAIPGGRVAPFGHLGITACVPLPRASRSLPRPSSPLCAQASPTCLPSLDHNMAQAELRALLSQSTYTNPYAFISWHATTITQGSVKIPFPTICRRPKRPYKRPTTHPLSFTFQTAAATSTNSRGEPCIVSRGIIRGKPYTPPVSNLPNTTATHQKCDAGEGS